MWIQSVSQNPVRPATSLVSIFQIIEVSWLETDFESSLTSRTVRLLASKTSSWSSSKNPELGTATQSPSRDQLRYAAARCLASTSSLPRGRPVSQLAALGEKETLRHQHREIFEARQATPRRTKGVIWRAGLHEDAEALTQALQAPANQVAGATG
jgi:hypothetical protein